MKIMNAKETAFFNKVTMVVEGMANLVSKITLQQAREWKPEHVDGSMFKRENGIFTYWEEDGSQTGYMFEHGDFTIYVSVKNEQGHQTFQIYRRENDKLQYAMYGGYGQFNQKEVHFYLKYYHPIDENELQEALVNTYIDFGLRVSQETMSTPSA